MKSISHLQLLLHSLTNPPKLAMYRILTVGKIIQYTFILAIIMTAFSLGQFVNEGIPSINGYEEIQEYVDNLQWLIYILSIILSFVMNTTLLYAKISIYAFVAFLLSKPLNRKAEYRHLWRTAALAITWEVFLLILFTALGITSKWTTFLCMLLTMTILFIALRKYPLLKK